MTRSFNTLFWAFFYFAVTVTMTSYWAIHGIDVHHDGIMLKPALDVSQGLKLFGETFTQYGALTTFIQALAIEIFGEKLIVIRLATAFFYGLAAVALWYIWKDILSPWLILLSYGLWMGLAGFLTATFLPWSSVYALFFQLFSVAVLVRWVRKGRSYRGHLFACGFLISCTVLCRQPVGITLFAAVILWLVMFPGAGTRNSFKQSLLDMTALILGVGAVALLFFAWLYANGSIQDWWIQNILWPKRWLSTLFPLDPVVRQEIFFMEIFGKHSWQYKVLPLACILCIVKMAFDIYVRKIKSKDLYVAALAALVAIGSWHQFFPVSCQRHTFWAATPMFAVFVFLGWNSTQILPKFLRVAALGWVVYFLFFDVTRMNLEIAISRAQEFKHFVTVSKPNVLAGMRLESTQAENFRNMAETLERMSKASAAPIVYIGGHALYPTLIPGYKNYHALTVIWPHLSELYAAQNIEALKKMVVEGKSPVLLEGVTINYPEFQGLEKVATFHLKGENQGTLTLFARNPHIASSEKFPAPPEH